MVWVAHRRFRQEWADNGLPGEDSGPLMVIRGGERLGFVIWRRRDHTAAYCLNIGIALLPGARGKGYGTEAHRLIARYLFAHTTVHTIEADTEVNNRRRWPKPDSPARA